MQNTAIKIEGLNKVYKLYEKPTDRMKESLSISKKVYHKERYVLKDINLFVKKGETVGIIGSNGAGKSTLLKIITGVLNATTGDISVEGKISALLELGAGFNMEYTGIENIYLNGTMMGYSKAEIEEKVDDIIAFADIGEFINQPVKTYSSGMFVRLAFAVAINIEPEILIVDEALSVGDIFFQAKCYKKFEEFKEKGKTILFVSHDLSSITKYCDRAILINQGELVAEGGAKEMVDLYKQLLAGQPLKDEVSEIRTLKEEYEGRWCDHLPVNPQKIEYGDQKAEIIDFAIIDHKNRITTNVEKGHDFTIRMKVRFNDDVKEPIFAFTIKDVKGTEIAGTNTLIENIKIPSMHSGDVFSLEFKQRMDLQGRMYLLSLGCTEFINDNLEIHHRLYDICSIDVISNKNTVGVYDMNSKVEILK